MFLICANLLSQFGLLDEETNHFDKAQAVHRGISATKKSRKKSWKKNFLRDKKIKDTYGLEF